MLNQLRKIFGERFTTNINILDRHGKDEAYHPVAPPDGVIFPETTEEIKEIVLLCSDNNIPIVPFGVGTSLEGGIGALSGGVCIDFAKMKDILEINQF